MSLLSIVFLTNARIRAGPHGQCVGGLDKMTKICYNLPR